MQVSALTLLVRGISHFCCHKSTFTSPVTAVGNHFWPGKTSPSLSFLIRRVQEGFFHWEGVPGGEMRVTDGREQSRR